MLAGKYINCFGHPLSTDPWWLTYLFLRVWMAVVPPWQVVYTSQEPPMSGVGWSSGWQQGLWSFWPVRYAEALRELKKNMIIWIQNITYDGELFQNAMNTVHEWSSNTMLYCDDATHRPKSWPPGPAPACLRPHIHTPRSPPLIYWALGGWEQWCGVYFRSRFPPWFSLMSALPVRGTSSRTEPEGRPSRNTSELSPYPSLEINVCLPLSLRAELELNKTKTEESVKKRFIKPGRIMFGVVEFVKQLQVIGLWIKRSDSDNNIRISILRE